MCTKIMTSFKSLVFSSVGDNTKFYDHWIGDDARYHLCIIYYGDDDEIYSKYKDRVNFAQRRKGSKFQNFKYFYDTCRGFINEYEQFFILDDDIIINVEDINKMFDISCEYNLQICAPSFSKYGKISHSETKHKKGVLLTYTNFIEVNVPLFTRDALSKFMDSYDTILIGYGIDFYYIWCNGKDEKKSYAVIHSVKCVNPHESAKKDNVRELERLPTFESRQSIWENYAKKKGIPWRWDIIEYEKIPLSVKSEVVVQSDNGAPNDPVPVE